MALPVGIRPSFPFRQNREESLNLSKPHEFCGNLCSRFSMEPSGQFSPFKEDGLHFDVTIRETIKSAA